VAEPLEALVFDAVLAAVDGGALDAVLRADLDDDTDAKRTELLTVLAEAEAKLAQAEERYLEGDVRRAGYLRVRDRHEGVAAGARRELAAIERTRLPEDIPPEYRNASGMVAGGHSAAAAHVPEAFHREGARAARSAPGSAVLARASGTVLDPLTATRTTV
jgi:hypothetical protein